VGSASGRLDFETDPEAALRRRRWVHDDDADALLVVNWQAPAARPFYVAHAGEPRSTSRSAAGFAQRAGGCST
jgi:DNA helicase IV